MILSFAVIISSAAIASDLQKLDCKEVEAIEAQCTEYAAASKACELAVEESGKAQIAAAKKEQDDCKKKHGIQYVMKCKNEIKKATTLVNTPSAALQAKIGKDLKAAPDSPCHKAEAIGNEQKLCKGPQKIVSTLKANCISGQ
jgi:hypothetical protein